VAIDRDINAGLEAGLRFAMVLPAQGSSIDLRWDAIAHWKPEQGFLWVHLERDDPRAQAWVREAAGLDPLVAMALLAEESRPRVEDVDDDLLVVLRGVDKRDDGSEAQLVPLHIWMEADRCITLRDKGHNLTALRDLRLGMMTGKGPRTAGGLMARIADKVADHLGILVAEMEDGLSDIEDRIEQLRDGPAVRADLASVRRRVVQLRRYLGPQRDALYRLRHDDASWLDAQAKTHLREVNDRLVRHLEDLDEIRQRATIVQEELGAMVAEQTNRNTFALSIVSVVMLPMTFVTGFFGMNTGALPFGAEHPDGTVIATAIIGMVGMATALVLRYGIRGKRGDR